MNNHDPIEKGISVSDLVSQIGDESPSLAWRSELNEKLLAQSRKAKKRSQFLQWLRPTVGIAALASAACVALVFTSTSHSSAVSGIEAALISEHRVASAMVDVVGPTADLKQTSPVPAEEAVWTQMADEFDTAL
jgi:hypothetical protein